MAQPRTELTELTHLSYYGALKGLVAVLPAPLAAPSRASTTTAVRGDGAGQVTGAGQEAEVHG